MNRIHTSTLATLACAAAALPAQFATFTKAGTSCANARNVQTALDADPPILGRVMAMRVTGYPGARGFLTFSTKWSAGGTDLTFMGMTGCRLYVDPNLGMTVPLAFDAGGRTQRSYYLPTTLPKGSLFFTQSLVAIPGANPLGAVTTNSGIHRLGIEADLTAAQIAAFAPLLRINPSEAYYPMRPEDFITLSRFRHHRTLASDQGYNKTTRTWVTTNSTAADYYNVPVSVIASFGLHADGKNRRPRDSNSGSSWNVFLQPNGRPGGDRTPTLDVPVYYHYRRVGDFRHEVQYWWFCGFNDSLASINHQGDWEHITVHIQAGKVVSAYYAAHNGGTTHGLSALQFSGTHPIVYVAKGSHASYNKAGTFHAGLDECRDGGYQWATWRNVKPLSSQPWRNYAGAWGEVGTIATTTGPLGPWHKRDGN